jgi:UDP-glucose 6-dehydrogenase
MEELLKENISCKRLSFTCDIQIVANAIGKDGRIGSKFLHPGSGLEVLVFLKIRVLLRIMRNLLVCH